MKKIIITICIIVVAAAIYLIVKNPFNSPSTVVEVAKEDIVDTSTTATTTEKTAEQKAQEEKNAPEVVIGKSVEDRDIKAYRFGSGEKEILFVGGIHGGYSWNTALIAYNLMDYLKENPSVIPEGVKVTVIPLLNPDGLSKVVETDNAGRFELADISEVKEDQVAGRFNGNKVDLNRNFDCDWKASGVWQSKTVSGGTKAFSEPETMAIKNYVENNKPTAVVAWYSAGGGVYASNCYNGVSKETSALVGAYSKASGYKPYTNFDFYEITGDMTNWFAKNNVPAISILLTTHTSTEWTKNKAGIEAVLKYYSK